MITAKTADCTPDDPLDPRKKALFERLCAEEDLTPSQVVRRLIRRYIEERTGQPWSPAQEAPKRMTRSAGATRRDAVARRRTSPGTGSTE